MAISTELLNAEREALKAELRSIETEQRRVEGMLKEVRQRELRTKREIEALTTLIDIQEAKDGTGKDPAAKDPARPESAT